MCDPFLERFTVVPTPTKRSSKVRKSLKKSLFHPFPRLPAELRARIWAIALQDRIHRPERSSLWIIWECVPSPVNTVFIRQVQDNIHVKTRRGYPTLFFVSREARYEAAKVDGGTWHSLGVGAIEMHVNSKKEHISVCNTYQGSRSSALHQISHRHGTREASYTYDKSEQDALKYETMMSDAWLADLNTGLEYGWWRK